MVRLAAASEEEEEEPEGQEESEALLEGCAVDGKSVRRSGDADRGVARTHIVSARLDNGLTVGQAAVPDQGNELTALRQLLPALELKDRVVTIDAMGCRTDVARTIADAEGWYLLAVKDSESNLHANRQRDFAYLDRTGAVAHDRHETGERGHGRIERRTCTIMGGPHGILEEIDPDHRWTALGSAVRVVAERTVRGRTTRAVRYYFTNLPVDTGAVRIADLVRGHWRGPSGRGNSLHWSWTTHPGGPLPPAHRPCRAQHGRPAARRPEHSDASAAVFLAQVVNTPAAQDGGPKPRPTGAAHGPVTTLSTPCARYRHPLAHRIVTYRSL